MRGRVLVFGVLILAGSPYMGWDYGDSETAVLGVALHSFEWMFVRAAPAVLIASLVGVLLMRKKE